MKWFLSFCAVGGLVAVLAVSSCGPQKQFCPTHPPDFSCFDTDGSAMGGQGGQDQGPCDGSSYIICGGKPTCGVSVCP